MSDTAMFPQVGDAAARAIAQRRLHNEESQRNRAEEERLLQIRADEHVARILAALAKIVPEDIEAGGYGSRYQGIVDDVRLFPLINRGITQAMDPLGYRTNFEGTEHNRMFTATVSWGHLMV